MSPATGREPQGESPYGPKVTVFCYKTCIKFETWSGRARIPSDRVRRLAWDARRNVLWAIAANAKEGLGQGVFGKVAGSSDVLMRFERSAWTSLPLESALEGARTGAVRAERILVSPFDGRVFVGTNKGLLVHDGSGLARYRFSSVVLNPTAFDKAKPGELSIGELSVRGVSQDSRGALWVATDHGLIRDNGRFLKIYSTMNGLESNQVAEVHAARTEVFVRTRTVGAGGQVQRITFEPVYTETYPRKLERIIERISTPRTVIDLMQLTGEQLVLYRPLSLKLEANRRDERQPEP